MREMEASAVGRRTSSGESTGDGGRHDGGRLGGGGSKWLVKGDKE